MQRINRFSGLATSLVLLTACHEQPARTTAAVPATPTPSAQAGPQCYAYTSAKDTVRLTLQTTEPTVTGQLSYRYFEKDRNQGTLRGTLHGDTLRAEYTFQAEGQESVRQVAFLRQGTGWIEGYGDVTERAGKQIFTQPAALRFESKNALAPVACPR